MPTAKARPLGEGRFHAYVYHGSTSCIQNIPRDPDDTRKTRINKIGIFKRASGAMAVNTDRRHACRLGRTRSCRVCRAARERRRGTRTYGVLQRSVKTVSLSECRALLCASKSVTRRSAIGQAPVVSLFWSSRSSQPEYNAVGSKSCTGGVPTRSR